MLRALFRKIHTLLNECIVSSHPSNPNQELIELHQQLQRIPEALLRFRADELKALLRESASIREILMAAQEIVQSRSMPLAEIDTELKAAPPFLIRPDRQWELNLWRASRGSSTWSLCSSLESATLEQFAKSAPAKEQELSKKAVVLAVSCLTPSGDTRQWEWHLLTSDSELDSMEFGQERR